MNINFQSRFSAQWNHVCRFQSRFQSRFHSLTHLFCTTMYVGLRSTAMRPRNNDRANVGGGGGGDCCRRRWSVMVKSVQQVVVVVVRRLSVAHLMCQRRLPLIIIIHDAARRHVRSLVVDHDLRQTLATLKTFSQSIKLQKPSGERNNARNNARCTQARKTTHSLYRQNQVVDRTLRIHRIH